MRVDRRAAGLRRDVACSKVVDEIIASIYDDGPAGLLHLRVLGQVVRCRIRVWLNGRVAYETGRSYGATVIDVEYRAPENRSIGHWSLRGGKSPRAIPSYGGNGCLFEVVAAQTGYGPAELRYLAAGAIRRDRRAIGRYVLARTGGSCGVADSMLGGARYIGRSPRDACLLLDAAQNGRSHPEGKPGHPRGHASYPPSRGRGGHECIENYSLQGKKTGFLSREDQNLTAHYTLLTDSAERLMDKLNRGINRADIIIPRSEIDYSPLPQMQAWEAGRPLGQPCEFRSVHLVGSHFWNKHNDFCADVFVVTLYPSN